MQVLAECPRCRTEIVMYAWSGVPGTQSSRRVSLSTHARVVAGRPVKCASCREWWRVCVQPPALVPLRQEDDNAQ